MTEPRESPPHDQQVVAKRERGWTKERHNSITPFQAWYEANPYSLVIPSEPQS